jgi:hypothetical protein
MWLLLGTLVLVANTAHPTPALDADRDLPPIPSFDDTPLPPPAPPVTSPSLAKPSPAAAPLVAPPGVAAPSTTTRPVLLPDLPWMEGGSGALALEVSSLVGAFAVRTGADVSTTHGPFAVGLGFRTGGNDLLSMTTVAAHGGWTFFSEEALDVSVGARLLAGVTTSKATADLPSTGLIGIAPEVSGIVHVLPWLSARADLSYRLVNAFTWTGPSGDRMSGLAATLGLSFGTP